MKTFIIGKLWTLIHIQVALLHFRIIKYTLIINWILDLLCRDKWKYKQWKLFMEIIEDFKIFLEILFSGRWPKTSFHYNQKYFYIKILFGNLKWRPPLVSFLFHCPQIYLMIGIIGLHDSTFKSEESLHFWNKWSLDLVPSWLTSKS